MNEAAQRAYDTLREHCSPEQRASLDAHRRFEAVGASGKRYIICVEEGVILVTFENTRRGIVDAFTPVQPTWTATVRGRYHHLPGADCALLVKLSIEACEEHWKAMAYMCGNVYVEDIGQKELAEHAAMQQALAERQRFAQLAQAGQLAIGTVWVTYNNRYQWNGQARIIQP